MLAPSLDHLEDGITAFGRSGFNGGQRSFPSSGRMNERETLCTFRANPQNIFFARWIRDSRTSGSAISDEFGKEYTPCIGSISLCDGGEVLGNRREREQRIVQF